MYVPGHFFYVKEKQDIFTNDKKRHRDLKNSG